MLAQFVLGAVLGFADPSGAAATEAAPTKTVSAPSAPAAVDLHEVEENVISYTNAERVRRGLRPLTICRNLMSSARSHAAWMTRSRNLQHTRMPVAENIAMGQRTSQQAVSDWMQSPGHRANILNAGYTRIGVAAYTAADGTIYWCQQFQ